MSITIQGLDTIGTMGGQTGSTSYQSKLIQDNPPRQRWPSTQGWQGVKTDHEHMSSCCWSDLSPLSWLLHIAMWDTSMLEITYTRISIVWGIRCGEMKRGSTSILTTALNEFAITVTKLSMMTVWGEYRHWLATPSFTSDTQDLPCGPCVQHGRCHMQRWISPWYHQTLPAAAPCGELYSSVWQRDQQSWQNHHGKQRYDQHHFWTLVSPIFRLQCHRTRMEPDSERQGQIPSSKHPGWPYHGCVGGTTLISRSSVSWSAVYQECARRWLRRARLTFISKGGWNSSLVACWSRCPPLLDAAPWVWYSSGKNFSLGVNMIPPPPPPLFQMRM